jgi:hypothetical protein
MKKIFHTSAFLLLVGTALVTSSFTTTTTFPNKEVSIAGNIEFKIENNTGSEFKYCVNGGHNYISSGSVKSFSYSEGQDFYYIDGSNCGKLWFEVKSDMQGKTYKLSDLL